VADDEDYRIDALRQELMREIDAVKNDVDSVGNNIDNRFSNIDTDIRNLRFWIVGLVSVFGVIAALGAIAIAVLAAAADII